MTYKIIAGFTDTCGIDFLYHIIFPVVDIIHEINQQDTPASLKLHILEINIISLINKVSSFLDLKF